MWEEIEAAMSDIIPLPVRTGRIRRRHTDYLIKLERLSDYLARAGHPPPGNTVVRGGLSRLRDIEIGEKIATGYG